VQTDNNSELQDYYGEKMTSPKTILRQYMKNVGLLNSKKREQILEIFLKIEKHPTINELYERVRKKNPKIGLATVYRAMKVICQAGLAREIDFGDGLKRYEHEYGHEHHDHLVCVKCGRIIEVMSPEIERIQNRLAQKHNFSPIRHRMQIFGTCKACKQKKNQK
jgi:Fur family ferric uptake transcriptional regulator